MKPTMLLLGAFAVSVIAGPTAFTTPLAAKGRSPSDIAVEKCLTEAVIVEKVEVLVGITGPLRYLVECEGERHHAAFKRVDEARRGQTRFNKGRSEINFTDSYRYERAAYLLDRELGINRVPVAVIRTVKGRDGAMVQWIENASMEMQLERKLTTQELVELASQKGAMHVFDALIYNTDRRPENWLIGTEDLKLYLIDHSRAFRWQHVLPEEFLRRPARLSRNLHDSLQTLTEARATELLEGLIDQLQIRALLARRDLILDKISQDLAAHGEAVVFSD